MRLVSALFGLTSERREASPPYEGGAAGGKTPSKNIVEIKQNIVAETWQSRRATFAPPLARPDKGGERRSLRFRGLVVALGLAFSFMAYAAEKDAKPVATPKSVDWPSFRNGYELLGVAHSALPDKLEVKWKFETGEMVVSTAAIVEGRVYVASLNGQLFCLDLKTGEKKWTYRSIDDPNPKSFAPGFKASPTVTADTVYLGDEDGVFHAVNRATGKQKWTVKSGAEIVSSATCYQDKVLFGSHDNVLYCVQATDGKLAWKIETQGPVNCTPAIVGNRTFVTGCDEHLRVINIDTGKEEIDMPLGTYLIASPAVVNEMLYVGTYASEVVAIDWQAKKKVWAFKEPDRDFPYHSCAALTADRVIVGGRDKRLHCLDRKTGQQVWYKETKGKVDSSPVVVGNRVFVGSEDGNVYAFEIATGKEVWKFNEGKSFSASPAVGEGHLVIGSESSDGNVYCFGK